MTLVAWLAQGTFGWCLVPFCTAQCCHAAYPVLSHHLHFPPFRSAIKRTAAAEPQQEQQEARPAKRARQGPFQLATDERGAAEQARLESIRRQQEELARQEAEFKVWGMV